MNGSCRRCARPSSEPICLQCVWTLAGEAARAYEYERRRYKPELAMVRALDRLATWVPERLPNPPIPRVRRLDAARRETR